MNYLFNLCKNKNGNYLYTFSKVNYRDGVCGSGHTLTGDFTQGDVRYDAARVNMGEPWMIFTKDQGQELIDNTTSEWINLNGVNGRKFTSKKDSKKYIFLPAGGDWLDKTNQSNGYAARHWSNDYYNSDDSTFLQCSSDTVEMNFGVHYYGIGRNNGLSIRGIQRS